MAEPFERSISALIPRVSDRAGEDVENALLNSILSLQAAAQPLLHQNYVAAYEAGGAEFYVRFDSNASSFYAQLHATCALAAALVASRAIPSLPGVVSLHALETAVNQRPAHPLAAELRTRRAEISLLRWLGRVRNQVVQHRVESGSLRASAIVANDGIAFVRTSATPDSAQVRNARSLLTGFNRKYGNTLPTAGTHEPLAYLDIASHFLFEWAEFGDFNSARRVVEQAAVFHLTVTPPLIRNADTALAALIAVTPVIPGAPFANRTGHE